MLSIPAIVCSQTPIHVTDLSFKMNSNSTEEFYYSFAAGDVIVVDFELKKGKAIDFEVIELPNLTKTKQYTARITNYRINVSTTKVYLFRVTNGFGNKMCSLSIKRIPKSQETADFNTGWQWKTLYDTTYTTYKEDSLVGHDTVYYTETVKEVASREMKEELLFNNTVEIRSIGLLDHDNPRSYVKVSLPVNQSGHNFEKKVIGWGYLLNVGDKSDVDLKKKNDYMVEGASVVTTLLSGSKLAGFIVGKVAGSVFNNSGSDNVVWAIVANLDNKNAFMNGQAYNYLRHGDGTAVYGKFVNDYNQGDYYICMYNDNLHDRIHVNVQASAVVETTTYKDVDYQRTRVVPKYVKLTKTRMITSSRQVRVPIDDVK